VTGAPERQLHWMSPADVSDGRRCESGRVMAGSKVADMLDLPDMLEVRAFSRRMLRESGIPHRFLV